MLLALVVQLASLANVGMRKSYNGQHEKQGQLIHVKNDLKREIQSNGDDPSILQLDNPSNYQLSLSGKLEPASDRSTINLSAHSPGMETSVGKCTDAYNRPCV